MALRGMSQANMDLGIFQETKVTEGIYTRRLAGYSVVASDAPNQHRGRVAENGIFAALQRAVLKPQAQDVRKNVWISEATLRLVADRVSVRRNPAKDQSLIWRLGCAIAASLKADRRRRWRRYLGRTPHSTGKLGTE